MLWWTGLPWFTQSNDVWPSQLIGSSELSALEARPGVLLHVATPKTDHHWDLIYRGIQQLIARSWRQGRTHQGSDSEDSHHHILTRSIQNSPICLSLHQSFNYHQSSNKEHHQSSLLMAGGMFENARSFNTIHSHTRW